MRSPWARLSLIVQTCLLIVLLPLAYATPPDPTWIPGIYDETDQDDVVGLLTDEGLALVEIHRTDIEPLSAKDQVLNGFDICPANPFGSYTLHPRAPPAA